MHDFMALALCINIVILGLQIGLQIGCAAKRIVKAIEKLAAKEEK